MSAAVAVAVDDDEDDGFEVSAITTADGTRSKLQGTLPKETDLLGVSTYAVADSDSDSNSSSSDSDGSEVQQEQEVASAANEKGTTLLKRDAEASVYRPPTRKRVHFAVPEDLAITKETVNDPVVKSTSGEEEEEEDLEAALAAFEAEVGATGEDREEQDVDLAEAEDAREEVFQDELRKRIQGMRARLKEGKGGGRVKLTMGGEEIGIKVNDKSMVANQDDGGEENSEESDGDMDLMHDWTQFNT